MAKKTLETELKEFEVILEERLNKISKNTNEIDVTNADKKFMNMYNTAIKKSVEYGDERFKKAFESAAKTYEEIIESKVRYVSNIKKIGEKIRIDNYQKLRSGLTPNELMNGEKYKKERE